MYAHIRQECDGAAAQNKQTLTAALHSSPDPQEDRLRYLCACCSYRSVMSLIYTLSTVLNVNCALYSIVNCALLKIETSAHTHTRRIKISQSQQSSVGYTTINCAQSGWPTRLSSIPCRQREKSGGWDDVPPYSLLTMLNVATLPARISHLQCNKHPLTAH